MASRRNTLISSAVAVTLAGGYGLYLVNAQAVPPVLAQAPMNITNVIPPAFIMGVDNSGSMSTDEALFRTSNGIGHFRNSDLSFFNNTGVPFEDNGSGGSTFERPMDGGLYADFYGAGRGPEFNRAYFNPANTYTPWLQADGTLDANASITSAAEDPRGSGNGANAPFTTFDFTSRLQVRERWRSGTTMPAGTYYDNDNSCNRESGSSNLGWRVLQADKTFTSNCDTTYEYYPARVYLSLGATPPPGFDLTKRVLIKRAGPQGTDLYRYDYIAANFTTGGAAAVQNFANWWTYYGNRNRSMIAAMTHAMADVTNMRVGYFQINPPPPAGNVTMRNMNVAADKQALYTQMRGLNASGNTPTRTATAYMMGQFARTDSGAPITLNCQKNAGMLFTDGYTNENDTSRPRNVLNVGDQDHSLAAPYGGGVASSNTIADYAMYGYNTNPRPDLLPLGRVPVSNACSLNPVPPGTDCNRNLHVNFYGVTLGARGAVYDVNMAATANPYTTAPSWGATETMNLNASNVDDIWHAALNSRGEFINANSPSDITAAMRRILSAVNEGTSPSGTIGVTGSRIGAGSLTIQPRYESTNSGTDWYSTLTAETVSANAITGQTTFTQAWEAGARLAAQASRTIRFGRTGSSTVPAISDFTGANVTLADLCTGPLSGCTAAEVQALATGGLSSDRAVDYLRGSRTDEGVLRTRTSILGDIINSPPTVVSSKDDYGYKALGGTLGTTYATYLASKQATNRPLVLVGANDGMLHVFDGRSAAPGGDEVFAYIPATSLGNMGNLLFPYVAADQNDQEFQHRYYVDGPITVSDVNIGGTWKTIAVGTTGAGGRSVFALDITNPAAITVLWEVNNLITGDTAISNNIGHVLSKPVIVPVKAAAAAAPTWKVIFGNGYNSTNQQAHLFIVDAATGSVQTVEAIGTTAPPAYNGLGNIVVVDRKRFDSTSGSVLTGRDRYSDTVYAADQQGAVWKFDLLGTPSEALGDPLFIARDAGGNRQSITGGLTAAAGPAGGVMLYFGTGSFVFNGDPDTTAVQTIYGILDRNVSLTGRSQLLQQTVGADLVAYRSTSANAMVAGKQGWYLDLPAGERFVGNPRIESGIVFFPAYEPSGTGSADCSVNGNNWLYGLNALSGGAALSYVRFGSPTGTRANDGTGAVALNTGGSAPVKDVAVMTAPRVAPLGAGATAAEIAAANNATCSMVVRVAGAPEMYLPRPCGRQSWRQVR